MNGTVELSPEQLAQLVCNVFRVNGFDATGLALHLKEQLVGYDRAVVHYNATNKVNVYPPPTIPREELDRMLYPNERLPTFAGKDAGTAPS